MKLLNVDLIRATSLDISDVGLSELEADLEKAPVFIANSLLKISKRPGIYTDIGIVKNVKVSQVTKQITGDILITAQQDDIRELERNEFQDVAIELELRPDVSERIHHIESVIVYLRQSDKSLFADDSKDNFQEGNSMSGTYYRKEELMLERLGFTTEQVKAAQEEGQSYKDALFDCKVAAAARGLSEDEIEALMKEGNQSESDSKYNADIIAAANESERDIY